MAIDDLYESLLQARARSVRYIVTFCDGDFHRLNNIDLCFSIGHDGQREHEPLRVDFDDCIGESAARRNALRGAELRMTTIWLDSAGDGEPVGYDYAIADVRSIFDDDRKYVVYSSPTNN